MSGIVGDNVARASGVIASAGSAGIWTKVATQDITTNTSTIDFTTLSTDYKDFRIIGSGIRSSSNNNHLYIRVSVASSWITSGSKYQTGTTGADIANYGSGAVWGEDNGQYFRLDAGYNAGSAAIGNSTGYGVRFQFTIADVHDTTMWKYANWESCFTMSTPAAQSTDTQGNNGFGSFGVGSSAAPAAGDAIDGLRVYMSGDVAEGNFILYGRSVTQEIIMTRYKSVNGVRIQFTAEEETARDAEEAQAVIDQQAAVDAATQLATDKASGNQKLLDLGLSQAEVDALTK